MNLVASVRDYFDTLVHASVGSDPLASARHRAFIVPRMMGGLAALAALPLYLVVRGVPNAIEIAVFCWLMAPIAVASFLSRTGRYEQAHILSAFAFMVLVTLISAASGGILSPAAILLAVVPLEAALCASRRIVFVASGFAFAGAALLLGMTAAGWHFTASSGVAPILLSALIVGSATGYSTMLALGTEALARASRRLLSLEEERYRLLALNMTDAIGRLSRQGVTLFMSPAAERVFGTSPQMLMGHGLFDRVHVADRPAFLCALADAAAGLDAHSVEFRVRRDPVTPPERDGGLFMWTEMRCRSLATGTGILSGGAAPDRELVAVLRDVTERKAQQQAIEAARSEAEKANAAKGRFLATMSHELRTPLNAVIGFSEMLMHEDTMQIDAARRKDYARMIHESGHHLLSVVNLVLDMSKLETGNFVITPEPFAPAAVVRDCCEMMALKARDAGLEVELRLPADLPELIADKRALKQMLLNLLSNAMKFTPSGGRVTVSATCFGGYVDVEVADTGVGIDTEDLKRVGDPFFQARGAYDRPYDGTGLGLSIVKGLVELHGGRMRVESTRGRGTRVTLRLPLDCERSKTEALRVPSAAQAAMMPAAMAKPAPATSVLAQSALAPWLPSRTEPEAEPRSRFPTQVKKSA